MTTTLIVIAIIALVVVLAWPQAKKEITTVEDNIKTEVKTEENKIQTVVEDVKKAV